MSSKEQFRHESLEDTESIVKYLNAIADGILKGKLVLGNESEQFSVTPEGLLKLEIKAKRKSDRVKLELEIGWKERGEADAPSGALTIDTADK